MNIEQRKAYTVAFFMPVSGVENLSMTWFLYCIKPIFKK